MNINEIVNICPQCGIMKDNDILHNALEEDFCIFFCSEITQLSVFNYITDRLYKMKVMTKNVSPNFVNKTAHELGITTLSSKNVVEILDSYESIEDQAGLKRFDHEHDLGEAHETN